MKNKLLTDYKHWIGWLISATAVYLIFWQLMTRYPDWNWIIYFVILLSVIVIVDVIKHKIELQ